MTKEIRSLNIPLPDPTRYRRVNYLQHGPHGFYYVVVHALAGAAGGTFWQPKDLFIYFSPAEEEARAVSIEMQTRLSVTRKLMDLEP